MQCLRNKASVARTLRSWGCQCQQIMEMSSHSDVSNPGSQGMSGTVRSFVDIPGPKGLPYFGTYFSHKLGFGIHKMMDQLQQWHQQYGDIFKETCLGHTVVHIIDPEAIRVVYANEDKFPHIEPLTMVSKFYREKRGFAMGIGNSNDEEWYRLRNSVQQLMMKSQNVLPFLPGGDAVTQDFIQHIRLIRDSNNEVPDFYSEIGRWSLENAAFNGFGKRMGYMTDSGLQEARDILKANEDIFDVNTQLTFSLPFYKLFNTPRINKLFQAEDLIFRLVEKHLKEALITLREKTENGNLADDEFLFLRQLRTRDVPFNDVVVLSLSMVIDGLFTSMTQLLFTLYLLAANPEVQQQMFEEISRTVPPHPTPLTAECIKYLPYTKACIKESQRLLPITNEISRITKKDMVLSGYHIPAQTSIHLDNQVLYHNPRFVPEPQAFLPERWLREESKYKVHPYIHRPFGHGARTCVGRRIAEQDMAVFLVRFLQNFRLEWHHPPMGLKFQTLNVPDCPARYTLYDR